MKLTVIVALALTAAVGFAVSPYFRNTSPHSKARGNIYEFTMDDIDGKPVKLSDYKGKVLLIVNVASKCGNTPQYKALEQMYEKYKDQGLVVMGFPANEFGGQEPGTNAEVKEFCTSTYNVKFPMFSKIVVKGEGTHPLYQWLLGQTDDHSDIDWNFAKFLVDKDGKVITRFKARTKPTDEKIVAAVESALATTK